MPLFGSNSGGPTLMNMPPELRLEIYDQAFNDLDVITIGSVLDERSVIKTSSLVPGLPANHIPVIRAGFDATLLDFTTQAQQIWSPAVSNKPSAPNGSQQTTQNANYNPVGDELESSPLGLLATSMQLRDEVEHHLSRNSKSSPKLVIHLSYPYGLIAAVKLYPAVLKMAKEIHIAGFYSGGEEDVTKLDYQEPTMNDAPHANGPNAPTIGRSTAIAAPLALKSLFDRIVIDDSLNPKITALTIRTFTPSVDGIFIDHTSSFNPAMVAANSVQWGKFNMYEYSSLGGAYTSISILPGTTFKDFVCYIPNWVDGEEDWVEAIIHGPPNAGDCLSGLMAFSMRM